jgi:hypothetical protein
MSPSLPFTNVTEADWRPISRTLEVAPVVTSKRQLALLVEQLSLYNGWHFEDLWLDV